MSASSPSPTCPMSASPRRRGTPIRRCWRGCGTLLARRAPTLHVVPAGRDDEKDLLLAKRLAVADELLAGQIDAFAVVVDDAADHLGAAAVALQNGQYRVAILLGDENAKPDAHIVDLMHLRIADVPQSLDQLKYRRR